MVKRRTHKGVFALQFPAGGGAISGSRVATSAPERRVGEVVWGDKLSEERALAMLRDVGIVPSEWALREHADYWVIRYRIDAARA